MATRDSTSTTRERAKEYHVALPVDPRELAPDLIISQYQASPNFLAYVDAYMKEVAVLTNALIDTYMYRYLSNAYGNMLDVVAEIVGVKRYIPGASPLGLFGFYYEPQSLGHDTLTDLNAVGGKLYGLGEDTVGDLYLTDEELYRYIKARILVNTQIPTIENLYKFTDFLYGRVSPLWELQEDYSGAPFANMHFDGYLQLQEKAFFSAIYLTFKIAGVKLTLSDLSGDIELLSP